MESAAWLARPLSKLRKGLIQILSGNVIDPWYRVVARCRAVGLTPGHDGHALFSREVPMAGVG